MSSTEKSHSEGNSSSIEKHITFSDEIEYKYLSGSDQSSLSLKENQAVEVKSHEHVDSLEKESYSEGSYDFIPVQYNPPNEIKNNVLTSCKYDNKYNSEQLHKKIIEETNPEIQTPQQNVLVKDYLPLKKRIYQHSNYLDASCNIEQKTHNLSVTNVVPDKNIVYSRNNKCTQKLTSQIYIQISPEKNTKNNSALPINQSCNDQEIFVRTQINTINQGVQTCDMESVIHSNKLEESHKEKDFVQGYEESSIPSDKENMCLKNSNFETMNMNDLKNIKNKEEKDSGQITDYTKYDLKCSEEMISDISRTPSSTLNTSSVKECNSESTDAAFNSIGSQSEGFGFSEATLSIDDVSLRDTIMGIKSIRIKDPGEFMSVSEFDPDDFDNLDKWDD